MSRISIMGATLLRGALKRKAEDSNPEPVTTRLFSKQPARPLAYLPFTTRRAAITLRCA